MKKLATLLAPAALLALALPAAAAPTFADSTFNLADYTITKSLQSGTGVVSQSASGGNPGSALEIDYTVPAAPPFTNTYGNIYFLNNGFTYDPSVDGALSSIAWSMDKKTTILQPSNFVLVNGQSFLVLQGGNYYAAAVGLASTQGVYQTASLTTSFSDFSLVTDMAAGTVNSALHPSFAAGLMEFGFRNGYGIGPQTAAQLQVFEDNFSVTLTPAVAAVPEPQTFALLLPGLALLAWTRARRARAV
jgi:hypothetical protein